MMRPKPRIVLLVAAFLAALIGVSGCGQKAGEAKSYLFADGTMLYFSLSADSTIKQHARQVVHKNWSEKVGFQINAPMNHVGARVILQCTTCSAPMPTSADYDTFKRKGDGAEVGIGTLYEFNHHPEWRIMLRKTDGQVVDTQGRIVVKQSDGGIDPSTYDLKVTLESSKVKLASSTVAQNIDGSFRLFINSKIGTVRRAIYFVPLNSDGTRTNQLLSKIGDLPGTDEQWTRRVSIPAGSYVILFRRDWGPKNEDIYSRPLTVTGP